MQKLPQLRNLVSHFVSGFTLRFRCLADPGEQGSKKVEPGGACLGIPRNREAFHMFGEKSFQISRAANGEVTPTSFRHRFRKGK